MATRVAAMVAGVLLMLLGVGVAPALAQPITGISDQKTAFLTDPVFESLGVEDVRLILPWDVAFTSDPESVSWLDTALASGRRPFVAFQNPRGITCPGSDCHGPTVDQYAYALAAFRQRWPQITQITPWNEPNHASQPTADDPVLAAQYYNAARRVCGACTIVAGDLLDDNTMSPYLASYKAALAEDPAIWGIHNYYDATYFSSQGVDKLLAAVDGDVWLTETGGIVHFGGLAYDVQRAADSIRWLYSLTQSRPRVKRMYLYHWKTTAASDFDAGLMNYDGTPRPALDVVREQLSGSRQDADGTTSGGARGGNPPGVAGTRKVTPTSVRLSGRALRLVRAGLRAGVACLSQRKRCVGRIVFRAPRTPGQKHDDRPQVVLHFDLPAGGSTTRSLRLSFVTLVAFTGQPSLAVTTCMRGVHVCQTQSRRLNTEFARQALPERRPVP